MKTKLGELKNVGGAMLRNLELLGIERIEDLTTCTPDLLYVQLFHITGKRPHPCVWDVFAAIIHESKTGEALPWYHWTPERKAQGGPGGLG